MSESSSDGTSHFAQGVPVDAVVPQIVLRYAQIHLRVNSRVNNMIKIKIERNESNQIKKCISFSSRLTLPSLVLLQTLGASA